MVWNKIGTPLAPSLFIGIPILIQEKVVLLPKNVVVGKACTTNYIEKLKRKMKMTVEKFPAGNTIATQTQKRQIPIRHTVRWQLLIMWIIYR